MASIFTHVAASLALGTAFNRPKPLARFWVAGALCAAVPDLDAVGFFMGIPYEHPLGHRGFTHSFAFSALLASLVLATAFRSDVWPTHRLGLWMFLFLSTASHALLDMLTDGGLGSALFWPLSNERYFFPWRVIEVSPIGIREFFSEIGVSVLINEFKWVWLPSITFACFCLTVRRLQSSSAQKRL
jgi:inner membrane protein